MPIFPSNLCNYPVSKHLSHNCLVLHDFCFFRVRIYFYIDKTGMRGWYEKFDEIKMCATAIGVSSFWIAKAGIGHDEF
jgi:hypothetical protein